MTSCEWAAAVTAIAIAIAQDKSAEEIGFMALLFSQLGDTLAVMAAEPPKCM